VSLEENLAILSRMRVIRRLLVLSLTLFIALIPFKGEGVTQDYHQAADWIRKAAEQGNPKAEYDLGLF
jgi:TPR repeat protein